MSASVAIDHRRLTIDATPYPWPFHGTLDPARIALVACCDCSWRPARPDADRADARLAQLAAGLVAQGAVAVAVTATPHPKSGRFGQRAEPPPPPADEPQPLRDLAHLELAATGVDGFCGSPLDGLLRGLGRTDLLLAGWGLEGPVHSTMRAANDRGYECLLVSDASPAGEASLAQAALEMVRHSGGIFGAHATSAQIMRALTLLPPRTEST